MPASKLTIRPPTSASEMKRLADVEFQSFAGFNQPRDVTERWLEHVGRKNLRIAIAGKRIVAGLGILEFGQYFGGRAIPAAGITCVAVAPEARGAGLAAEFMRTVMKDLAAKGFPLSVLYPSTYGLYRKAGFEPAGIRARFKLEIASLGMRKRARLLVALEKKDHSAIRALYDQVAPQFPGKIARTDREWRRILVMGTQPVYAYGIPRPGSKRDLDGYIVYHQTGADRAPYEIHIRDACAANRAAIERLLAFLGDHGTMASAAYFETGHADPFMSAAREEWVQIPDRMLWMVRVLNVPTALTARGYSHAIRAEVEMEIDDDLIAANAGRFVLTVAGGSVRVRPGGSGGMRLNVRGLAPLLTGHLSAEQLQIMGLIEGSPDVVSTASAIFAGPAPGMNERF